MDLNSISIVEQDVYGDWLFAWVYPSMDQPHEKFVMEMCKASSGFQFSRFRTSWIYMLRASTDKSVAPHVSTATLVMVSPRFNPEKFQALLTMVMSEYIPVNEPTIALECFLSVFSTQQVTYGPKVWRSSDYRDDMAVLANNSIKEAISTFDVESIILWHAMAIKKRIIVISESMSSISRFIRSLPLFVWHRLGDTMSILRPYVPYYEDVDDSDAANRTFSNSSMLSDLKSIGVYVAGFTDRRIIPHEELYDVLVDLDDRAIIVASHSKNDFALGSLHKDIASNMMNSATAAGATDQAVIKVIARKTAEIAARLNSLLASQPEGRKLTAAVIRDSFEGQSQAVVRFLVNFAMAESMI